MCSVPFIFKFESHHNTKTAMSATTVQFSSFIPARQSAILGEVHAILKAKSTRHKTQGHAPLPKKELDLNLCCCIIQHHGLPTCPPPLTYRVCLLHYCIHCASSSNFTPNQKGKTVVGKAKPGAVSVLYRHWLHSPAACGSLV